ncbi:hypothetical protein P170DRAFT_191229 [Aspergillus steynii IBT 23096]|uniref:Uncharacterized protein n=1 Tax=Aspergillus steynii IBT 23096 TaxID=1392250 RepID=A0A2I2G9X6_9EURO|nr:uncharacterized protein P170DRAFT_191229 [Aspergillus steynii IBT 23096]PLB49668.1 hypothetical protein P170DRAFT_191229 [Aspergillus steynii IBT 23096]
MRWRKPSAEPVSSRQARGKTRHCPHLLRRRVPQRIRTTERGRPKPTRRASQEGRNAGGTAGLTREKEGLRRSSGSTAGSERLLVRHGGQHRRDVVWKLDEGQLWFSESPCIDVIGIYIGRRDHRRYLGDAESAPKPTRQMKPWANVATFLGASVGMPRLKPTWLRAAR